jgi:hypothetical protein
MKFKILSPILIFFIVFSVITAGCTQPESGTGTLQLTSTPTGAEIYLDNQYKGSTPATITGITPVTHTLEFRYPGYQSWTATIAVAAGTSQYSPILSPESVTQQTPGVSQTPIPVVVETLSQTTVTVQASKTTMVVGDSINFYGTVTGADRVLLTMYGPGIYANGKAFVQQNANSLGSWSYTWNPGSSVQNGAYTLIVTDPWKVSTQRVDFTIIGGGVVSVSSSSYAASSGSTVTFSGQCTTGAQNVQLVLSGPGQYAGGVVIGSVSVLADKTWNFRYTIDSTMPTGSYTVYVYDIPKTSSGSTQFTIGFAS